MNKPKTYLISSTEAEAVKLFSNSFLALCFSASLESIKPVYFFISTIPSLITLVTSTSNLLSLSGTSKRVLYQDSTQVPLSANIDVCSACIESISEAKPCISFSK